MRNPSLIESCHPLVRPALSEEEAAELERLFKAIADRHRVRILNLLTASGKPMCVCELMDSLKLSQPAVSYHLKLLTEAGLLERRERGRYSYFQVAPGVLERLGRLVSDSGRQPRSTRQKSAAP